MIKEFIFGEGVVRMKTSAGTGILYRMAFNKDLTQEIMKFTKLRKSVAKINREDIENISEEDMEKLNGATSVIDTLVLELSFIMNAEATQDVETIFEYVSDKKNYMKFLLGLNSEAMTDNKNDILNFYLSSMRGNSTPKN